MERQLVYIMSRLFTAEEMDKMEQMVSSFLEEHDILLTPPVDIFKLATELGFDVRAARLQGGVDGLVIVDESRGRIANFRSNKVIAYNALTNITEAKFIVGHELAHYIAEKMLQDKQDKHVVVAARDPDGPRYSGNEDEQRKDYMAAALLIPRDDLLKRLPEKKEELSQQFYQDLAEYYRVDLRLAKRRVKEVALWQAAISTSKGS